MTDHLQAEYDQLQALAARFGKQSEVTRDLTRRVQQRMKRLEATWQGEGAAAFFSEMTGEVLPATTRLAEALAQAQRATTQIATLLQGAEQEAAALFRGQGQGGTPIPADAQRRMQAANGDTFGTLPEGSAERWAQLSAAQQRATLQNIINDIAAGYGMPAPTIQYEDLDDSEGNFLGYWSDSEKKLVIDSTDVSNPVNAINTAAHEFRHAFQNEMVRRAEITPKEAALIEAGQMEPPTWPYRGVTEAQAIAWGENFANYQVPERDGFDAYWTQPVEVDARTAGEAFVNGLTLEQLETYIPPPPPRRPRTPIL